MKESVYIVLKILSFQRLKDRHLGFFGSGQGLSVLCLDSLVTEQESSVTLQAVGEVRS